MRCPNRRSRVLRLGLVYSGCRWGVELLYWHIVRFFLFFLIIFAFFRLEEGFIACMAFLNLRSYLFYKRATSYAWYASSCMRCVCCIFGVFPLLLKNLEQISGKAYVLSRSRSPLLLMDCSARRAIDCIHCCFKDFHVINVELPWRCRIFSSLTLPW